MRSRRRLRLNTAAARRTTQNHPLRRHQSRSRRNIPIPSPPHILSMHHFHRTVAHADGADREPAAVTVDVPGGGFCGEVGCGLVDAVEGEVDWEADGCGAGWGGCGSGG